MDASPTGHSQLRKRALVVQHDPGTRKLICEQLTHQGFEVDAGSTIAEGAAQYQAQPLVVTSTDRDPMMPRGFIAWLHENHPDENTRPYILAICDRESSLSTPPQNRAWDELLTLPVKGVELRNRIEAIGTWVDSFLEGQNGNGNGDSFVRVPEEEVAAVPVPKAQERQRVVVRAKFPNRKAQTVEAAPTQRLAEVGSQSGAATEPVMKVPPPPSLISPKTAPVKPITPPTGPVAERTKPRPALRNTGLMSPTEQFQALVDNAPVALAMLDKDLRYLVVNRKWLRDFRLENVELIGRSHLEVFPQLGENWSHVYQRALEGMPDRSQPDIFVHPDGTQSWVRWEVQPWTDSGREIQGITISCEAVNQDPTANSPSELELIGHSLLKGKVTPALSLSMEGIIEEASEACLGFAPTNTSTLKGQHFWEIFVGDQRREDMRLLFLAAAKETRESEYFAFPPTFVTEVQLSSGGETTMAWTNSPRYDGTGRVCGLVCLGIPIGDGSALLNDIDKARKGRQNLSGAASYYATEPSAILEQISFGIVLLDPERNTLYANPEHRHLLGYDVETFDDIEDWIRQAAPNPNQSQAVVEDWRTSVWQHQVTKVLALKTRDGVLREIEFRPRPTSDGGLMLTLFDVTERRRGEEALRSSEAKFRALFQDAGVGIVLEDTTGAIFDANPIFEAMMGVSRADLRRSGLQDWVEHSDRPQIGLALQKLDPTAASRHPANLDIRLVRQDQSQLIARTTISRVYDGNGRLLYTAYFIQDVTSEREATSNFQLAEQQNRALFQAIPDLILLLDSTGRVIDVIPAASGMLLSDAAEGIGKRLSEIAPALAPHESALLQEAVGQDGIVVHEFDQPFADGSSKALTARLARCGTDHVVAVIQVNTSTKEADNELRRLALTFHLSEDAIIIANLAGKITEWNPAAEKMFGYRSQDIVGHGLATLFSPNDRPAFNNVVADSLSEYGEWGGEVDYFRSDGSQSKANVLYYAIDETGDGEPTAILGINRPM